MTNLLSKKSLISQTRHQKQTRSTIAPYASAVSATQAPARKKLGKSSVETSECGIGAWSFGDRTYWTSTKDQSKTAYEAAIDAGLTFIDTAEVYGFGKSEEFLGEFMKASSNNTTKPEIATKFAPQPWRHTPESVVDACKASLARLQLPKVALYMQHWPGFFLNTFSNDAYLEGFAMCYDQGMCDALGVSNFNEQRVRKAAKYFESKGTCLASNQVQYSLLYREPERNGVLEACRDHGVELVAYSPICQGLLSGKYSKDNPPKGARRIFFTDSRYDQISVLLDLMKTIGKERERKSTTQIAINWTMCKGTLPIPGAITGEQVKEIAGAVGWRLSEAEVAELDKVSSRIPSSTGAPFEKW